MTNLPRMGAEAAWRQAIPDRAEWRAAWRSARRQPLVSATVVLALSTGIALATAGFGFLRAVLWGELPFPQGDRFVRLRTFTPEGERGEVEPARYRFLRERAASMAYLGALATGSFNVVLPDGDVEAIGGARLTPGWFAYAGYAPIVGRPLTAADGNASAPAVAVVRESFWRRRLGGDPAAIGSELRVGGERFTIVGVAPDSYGFPGSGELWLATDELEPRGEIRVAGVLADGASLDSAAAELERLSAYFDAAHAVAAPPRLGLRRAADLSGSGIDVALTLLLGLLLLVLLLVASNVANLSLARAAARAGELSLRSALGASRLQLARQLVAEVLLLGAVAAVAGTAGAQTILGWIERRMAGDDLPFWFDFGFSPATAIFVIAITTGACAVAGALPALRATADPARRLASSARAGDRFSRGAALAIVGEMALAVALAVSALAIARGAALATASGGALPARKVATAQLSFDGDGATARRDSALDAVRAASGVVAAGAGTSLPYLSAGTERVEVEPLAGETASPARRAPVVGVTTGYLEALAGSAGAGRLFAAADFAAGAAPVAVVNAPFVARFLGGGSPLGRRLRVVPSDRDGGEPEWREIVGVVPELGLGAGDPELAAGVYLPLDDESSAGLLFLAARAAGDSAALAAPLRRALFAHDPDLAVRRVQPLEAVAAEDRSVLAAFAAVLHAVAAIALGLSLLGVYAVVSFRVARRTREIGVRVALGATAAQVTRLVLGSAAKLFAAGAVVGAVGAASLLAVRGAIFVARFPGAGPWVFPSVVLALGAAGLAACWSPLRRALAIDPARALASE